MQSAVRRNGSLQAIARNAVVYAIAAYTNWVLFGVVAFVSHLGKQAPLLAPWLPALGQPGRGRAATADGLIQFLVWNVPLAVVFVVFHSVFRPKRLMLKLQRHGRLVYNFLSAVLLHAFMYSFIPLNTPIVLRCPLPTTVHVCLSCSCFSFAAFCFFSEPGTGYLLGISRSLGLSEVHTPPGMDAITWMGQCVWRRGGALAFVLFTGISILPPELTLGDAVTRAVAAAYLRIRSEAFRSWLQRIESAHKVTWIVRVSFLCIALGQVQSFKNTLMDWRILAAVMLALVLRMFEIDLVQADLAGCFSKVNSWRQRRLKVDSTSFLIRWMGTNA